MLQLYISLRQSSPAYYAAMRCLHLLLASFGFSAMRFCLDRVLHTAMPLTPPFFRTLAAIGAPVHGVGILFAATHTKSGISTEMVKVTLPFRARHFGERFVFRGDDLLSVSLLRRPIFVRLYHRRKICNQTIYLL